jgi:hypothetical protein
MRLGLHALGIGPGAQRDVIAQVASVAEERGFSTLWAGEHVAMFDRLESRYPYAADGLIAVPPDADWLDPMIALSFAAAATTRIRLATGVLLLPEHNPVILAKPTASLDSLSAGRLTLGSVSAGRAKSSPRWGFRSSAVSLGLPNTPLRCASSGARIPPPSRRGQASCVQSLRRCCAEAGSDLERLQLAVSLRDGGHPSHLSGLTELGIDELVRVGSPRPDLVPVSIWVGSLAEIWFGAIDRASGG